MAKEIEVRWDEEFTEHYDLDLGDGHYLRWTTWSGEPDGQRDGAILAHGRSTAPHGYCMGGLQFDTEASRRHIANEQRYWADQGKPQHQRPTWSVESWDPLTISPSVLCRGPVYDVTGNQVGECGDHGFIREGRWVRA